MSATLLADPVPSGPLIDGPKCQLLGQTALIVQGVMGVLVILSLVLKRHREHPPRPWRIWLFDVSKQIAGQMFVHGLNVLISDILQHISAGNACVFYFLNILVDTTLGVGIIYVVLHALTDLTTKKFHWEGFQSGMYGDPPSGKFWLRQATVYVMSITTMKLLVVALFAAWPGIFKVGVWLLSWTGDGSNFQIVFVMGIFPILMNVIQFWLIDSIVKASTPASALPVARSDALDREPLFRASDDDDDDSMEHTPRPHDVENPAPPPHPAPHRDDEANKSEPPEHKSTGGKSTGSATPSSGGHQDHSMTHAYPPTAVDGLRVTTARSPSKRVRITSSPAVAHAGKRRSPPAPLHPRSPLQPALNSSIPMLEDAGQPYLPRGLHSIGITRVVGSGSDSARTSVETADASLKETEDDHDPDGGKEWDLSWDSEDWSDPTGADDWTRRNNDAAPGFVADAWGAHPPPVIQVG